MQHGLNGFVYPAGQMSALAEQLCELLADPGTRKKMGNASSQLIHQWSYREDLRGIIACLENVLDAIRSKDDDSISSSESAKRSLFTAESSSRK